MRRTSAGDVLAAFLLLAAAGYAIVGLAYEDLPALPWLMTGPLVLLAGADFVAASRVRAAVSHKAGHKPITALAIARCVALAKASVLGGAGMAGVMAGFGLRVLPDVARTDAARHDAYTATVVLVISITLVVSGVLLESATVDPARRRR